jgi:hypothetical protein
MPSFMPTPSFVHVRIAGLVHLVLGTAAIAALAAFPFFRFMLPAVFPVALAAMFLGFQTMKLKSRLRHGLGVISGVVLFFLLPRLPGDAMGCCRDAAHFFQTLGVDGGLLLANAYVLWALYFSKDAAFYRAGA